MREHGGNPQGPSQHAAPKAGSRQKVQAWLGAPRGSGCSPGCLVRKRLPHQGASSKPDSGEWPQPDGT